MPCWRNQTGTRRRNAASFFSSLCKNISAGAVGTMGFHVELKAGGGSGVLLGNFKRVVGQLAKQNPQLEIGFPEGSTYPDGKSVAYIAYIQNVGLGGVPERPFMQKTVEEKSKDWMGFLERIFKIGRASCREGVEMRVGA